ncbi:hypothetical protein VTL71DRAFT_4317 [Oculimacula yallundae]|uniref:Uncharacterized protein n=1 Tax=Oculimacula yallundae TaxID=86028 RepID=A0ABR4C785_9HELO
MDNLLDRLIDMPSPLTTWIGEFHGFVGTHLTELTCSSMFGSAFALPSFASPMLRMEGIYTLTLGIFTSSAVGFGWLHRLELKKNAPIGLVLNISVALMIMFTLKPSANECAPYMPLFAAIGLMVTIHVVPWARKVFPATNIQTLRDYVRAGQTTPASGSDGASVDSGSIHSRGISSWILNEFTHSDPEPRDVEYTGYTGRYNMADLPEVLDTLSVSEDESRADSGSSTTFENSTNRLSL